jgi:hypothetical protein
MTDYLDIVVNDGGVRGPEGPAGSDGTSTWSGEGVPTSDIGNTGDFYFDKNTNIFYGPKNSHGEDESLLSVITHTFSSTLEYELGISFAVHTPGQITAFRYYRGSSSQTSRVMTLWDASGQVVVQATTSGETGTGWFTWPLDEPVELAPADYTVSYGNLEGFTYFKHSPLDVDSVSTDSLTYHDGRFTETLGTFPDQDGGGQAYLADIVFQPVVAWQVAIAMANQAQVESNTTSIVNLNSDLAGIDARVDATEGSIATINGNLDSIHGRVTNLEAATIVVSPDGTHYKLTVTDDGVLGTTAV